jgi:hypothetical protein
MTRQTVRELAPAVGATVMCRFEEMYFAVKVLDAKNSYGKTRLLVQPVNGRGEQWIEMHRLGNPVNVNGEQPEVKFQRDPTCALCDEGDTRHDH